MYAPPAWNTVAWWHQSSSWFQWPFLQIKRSKTTTQLTQYKSSIWSIRSTCATVATSKHVQTCWRYHGRRWNALKLLSQKETTSTEESYERNRSLYKFYRNILPRYVLCAWLNADRKACTSQMKYRTSLLDQTRDTYDLQYSRHVCLLHAYKNKMSQVAVYDLRLFCFRSVLCNSLLKHGCRGDDAPAEFV